MRDEGRGMRDEVICAVARALRYPVPRPQRDDVAPEFFDETAHVDDRGLEELYTRTFDLNPVATLEVGWHLWGEQYERGRFLADLRALQDRLGIDAGTELPDHLTVLLPTIAASQNEQLRETCAKAIEKILTKLDEQGNPYRHLLRAAHSSLIPHPSSLESPEATQ
jgi:nitrate reductase assembly molybdenum cofactor insertion protein NarJ